ncbi:MAG: substrate-binding domain-containing protein [Capsulimonadaceae bacterium]
MNRNLATLIGVAGMLALAGCSHSGGGPAATTSASSTKILLGFVTNNTSDYWNDARNGTADAAKEFPNVEVQFVEPNDASALTQKSDVDDLMAKGAKGIAISPVDPPNQTTMLNGVASQAVLITQDSDAPLSNRVCYIGTDNTAAGKMAGDEIKKALPNGGKIMVFVGKRDAQNAKEREAGLRAEITGSKIQILDVRTDDGDPTKAKSNAADAIVKYPDLAGMVGLWGYNGPQCLSAVEDAHKSGQIKIVCFDGLPPTVAGIKDGGIYAAILQQPYVFGKTAVEDMVKSIHGDKSWVPARKQILVPTTAITKDNVATLNAK